MSGLSQGEVWLAIALVGVVAAVLKGIGPMVLGGRPLPRSLTAVVVLLPSSLLAALVVTTALADGATVRVGAVTVGVVVGGGLVLVRAPLIVAVLVAAAVTAGLRAFGYA